VLVSHIRSIPRVLEMIFERKGAIKVLMLLMIAEDGANALDISKKLGLPLATVYKYLRELEEMGLVKRKSVGGKRVFVSKDFRLRIQWRADGEELEFMISPKNLVCFLAMESPDVSYFIERRGLRKFLEFTRLYEDYVDGRLTLSMMARILGVTTMEVAVLIDEVEAVATV